MRGENGLLLVQKNRFRKTGSEKTGCENLGAKNALDALLTRIFT
jgi:hypothetical protein